MTSFVARVITRESFSKQVFKTNKIIEKTTKSKFSFFLFTIPYQHLLKDSKSPKSINPNTAATQLPMTIIVTIKFS